MMDIRIYLRRTMNHLRLRPRRRKQNEKNNQNRPLPGLRRETRLSGRFPYKPIQESPHGSRIRTAIAFQVGGGIVPNRMEERNKVTREMFLSKQLREASLGKSACAVALHSHGLEHGVGHDLRDRHCDPQRSRPRNRLQGILTALPKFRLICLGAVPSSLSQPR